MDLVHRLHDFLEWSAFALRTKGLVFWLVTFAPIMIFAEVPKYVLPQLLLFVAKFLGLPRRDEFGEAVLENRCPLVTVIVAGRNESASIEQCILSLLDQSWPNLEVIVVDDSSEDGMDEIARRYSKRGLIQFLRNDSLRGRGGRPSATNLGMRMARGEFVISLDADTNFDRSMVAEMIQPFADPRVGVVAGNVQVDNWDTNMLTRIQAIEYQLGIDLYKRWTTLFGGTLQASGALGAFRREAVHNIGGWDPELAEDTDVSLRMIRSGWRIAFSPRAVGRTEAPDKMAVLGRQRARWDRGGIRVFLIKHAALFDPRTGGFAIAFELAFEMFFFVLGTLVLPLYLLWVLLQGPYLFLFVTLVSSLFYTLFSLWNLIPIRYLAEERLPTSRLIGAAMVMPFYREWLRWVRLRAFIHEFLLIRPDDTFLPSTAWANSRDF